MKRNSGFTIIELVTSLAILLLLTAYLTQMMVEQSRTYTVVDQVTEVQQNLRAITDLIEREVRVTGFLVNEVAAVCGIDNTNGPDILFVTDSDPLLPDPTAGTQSYMAMDLNPATYGGAGVDTVNASGLGTTVLDSAAFYDNDNDGTGDADFMFNPVLGQTGGVIIADRANPGRGAHCGLLTAVGANSVTVDFGMTVTTPFGTQAMAPVNPALPAAAGVDLIAIPAHVYMIIPAALTGGAPQLWRDGMMLADDVEDLQFAMFYDLDDDGTIDLAPTHEYPGSLAPGVQYVSNAWDNSDLRELRVNFVVRTRSQDVAAVQNPAMAQGQFANTENRIAVPGTDGFRRRIQTMLVRPRNIGLRPIGIDG